MNTIIAFVRKLVGIRKIPKKGEGFVWIDGEYADEDTGEDIEEPLPMFYVGDYVQMYNPYEGGFMMQDFESFEPERREIIEYEYDNTEKVFRYRLADTDGEDMDELWYSEEWLSLPSISSFATTKKSAMTELTIKKSYIEELIIMKSIEDDLRSREIDRLLDMMNEGTEEERKVAEEELRKLTGGVAE